MNEMKQKIKGNETLTVLGIILILHTIACGVDFKVVITISPTSYIAGLLSGPINENLDSNIVLKLLSLKIGLTISFSDQV